MDLIPTPDQVVAAATNVAHKVLRRGWADLRPMPRTLVQRGVLRELYHYAPDPTRTAAGDPVLLVSPLAAPASCFDLRRGCSLVEHLVEGGRPTYLVEYGEVSFGHHGLSIARWVQEVVPLAVAEASRHSGGRPVHVVGWGLGGVLALLATADRPDLPVASLSSLASPVDVTLVPLVAPFRSPPTPPGDTGGALVRARRALSGLPGPVVDRARQLTIVDRLVTRPLTVAAGLDDADFLAQIEAVEHFGATMTAYSGRSYGQLFHRLLAGSGLGGGTVALPDRQIALADLTCPLLVMAGESDGIAPVASVERLLQLVPGVAEVRFELVPGGHLGMLTGRAARNTTWPVLDAWLHQHDGQQTAGAAAVATTAVPKPATRTPASRTPGAKKTPASKRAAAKKAAARKAAAPTAKPTTKAVPKRAASKKTVPEQAAPKKAAPKRAAPKKAAAKKSAPTKASARKAATRKAAARRTSRTTSAAEADAQPVLGGNPARRYGSASSRTLAPK